QDQGLAASNPAHGAQAQGDGEHAEPTAEDFLEAEELLKTPKGRSPLVYGGLILLLIFLLVVFVAGDAIYQMQGQRASGAVMRWEHPTEGTIEVSAMDFRETSEKLRVLARTRLDEEDVARFLLLDRLASDSGVRVGQAELIEALEPNLEAFGGDIRAYQASLSRFPGGVKGFEQFVQNNLAAGRFQAIVRQFMSVPTVDEVIESWATSRQLYTFDYAIADAADYLEQARAEEPTEEDLQAWFDGLSQAERMVYERSAERRVELIGALLTDTERTFDALLAAYPAAEEVDPEAQARDYYQRCYFTRFRRETPIPADAEGAPEDMNARIYYPFEEVLDQVIVEAAVKAALDRWREDLGVRMDAGEEIDLSAEAERLGLDFLAPTDPVSQIELQGMEGLGGLQIASPVFGLQDEGGITSNVAIASDALIVGRVLEIVPPYRPKAAELRDELLEPYAEDRSAELAMDVLADVREQLLGLSEEDAEGETPAAIDSQAFADAAAGAGLEVGRIADFDRTQPRSEDPTPAESFLRSEFRAFMLDEGALSEPSKAFDADQAYLLLLDEKRDPDLSTMEAGDFQRMLTFQRPTFEDPFSIENLREHYGLWLYSDPEPGSEEAGEGAGEPETSTP
ncbi:MAG: hypothetical protein ACYSWX_10505, partial [Planctomycetota bacterium]